jgi:predicted ATPase/DNA-binding winged helix-turn-helix (wHTH) protein
MVAMSIPRDPSPTGSISFGQFRLFPSERLLKRDGVPLAFGSRAMDILMLLVERAGEVVSKKELISRAWPGMTVDESGLRVHIAGVRKALEDGRNGNRYVANIPGRGYCFVAPITREADPRLSPAMPKAAPEAQPSRLPPRLKRMVGRDETVHELSTQILDQRFITITGAGGMGKTTVAISVAHELIATFDDARFFVDLGEITDSDLVAGALAAAFGLLVPAHDPLPSLIAFVRERRLLLVLDNCEHVVGAVAAVAEQLFNRAPGLHILATSREALHAEGEQIYRLQPLSSPPPGVPLSAAEALTFPAVQLFVERAAASGSHLELGDDDAGIVAGICSRLDGVALAIELAAGRVGAHGLAGTAGLLDNRFRLYWQGRRTAQPRHRTLSALLDWSYNLLPEYERLVLRRLSLFVGGFSLEAACAVATDSSTTDEKVVASVGGLVEKSLLSTIVGVDGAITYRLLETTRAYALEKLTVNGEADQIARRHATYFARVLSARDEQRSRSGADGHAVAHATHLGNARAALGWCFGGRGDVLLGIEIAAGSAALFVDLSLLTECYRWSRLAVSSIDKASVGTPLEMDLQEALAISAMFTKGNSTEVQAAIGRGLELARMLDDKPRQLRLLACLNIFQSRVGDFRGSLGTAEQSLALASEVVDESAAAVGNWMLGVSYALLGDQRIALQQCETGFSRVARNNITINFLAYSHRVRALVALSRVLWLRGHPHRAMTTAQEAVAEASEINHPVNMCISFVYCTQVFLWCGDWSQAERVIDQLIAYAERHSLAPFHAVGLGLRGELLVRTGEPSAGSSLLRAALTAMQAERHNTLIAPFRTTLAEAEAAMGDIDGALAADATILAEENGGQFHLAERLRVKGRILSSMSQGNLLAAERVLVQSLELARREGALGWELRTATTLARLRADLGEREEAWSLLAGIYEQFTDGAETHDLSAARTLLGSLSPRALLGSLTP